MQTLRVTPNVCLITDSSTVHYARSGQTGDLPFYFDILEDGTLSFSANNWEYSFDNGTWNTASSDTKVEVHASNRVFIRQVAQATNSDNRGVGGFNPTCLCDIGGNIMSLKSGSDFLNDAALYAYQFSWLFANCSKIRNAKDLVLPVTTLANSCYSYMFYGCTSLTSAPELPAVALADSCYLNMFEGCTNLTSAPELPATTLASHCYYHMFIGCTGLTSAPELSAKDLAYQCYGYMFRGCKNLISAPALPATTLADQCYIGMFHSCTSLTSVPELPATTLTDNCYNSMFRGCTSLTSAPELPATTLAIYCYSEMFYGCKNLTSAPALPATTLTKQCYRSMFQNCTSLTVAPELPATTLTDWCYYEMFSRCSSLNYIKMLADDISASNCLQYWLSGVASAGTFVKAAGVTIPTGTSGIPSGWTVEEVAV